MNPVAVLGLPDEAPTQMLLQALSSLGTPTVVLNQRQFERTPLHSSVGADEGLGALAQWLGGLH